MTFSQLGERVWQNLFTLEAVYYLTFFVLLLGFIISGKVCPLEAEEPSAEDELMEKSGLTRPKSFTEKYCGDRDRYTLNIGVVFLVMAAGKKMYGSYATKMRRA